MLFRIQPRDFLRAVLFTLVIAFVLPALGGFTLTGGLGLATLFGVVTAALYLVGASAICWLARRITKTGTEGGGVTLLAFFLLNIMGAALLMALAEAVPTLFAVANWGAAIAGGFMLSAAAAFSAINEHRK